MRMTIRAKGYAETQAMLRQLPQAARGEALREPALEGAEVIRKQAEQNALKHKRTGTLAKSIEKEVAKESLSDRVVVHVGPTKDGWYGRLLEMGHAVVPSGQTRAGRRARKTGKLEQSFGRVPPNPWLRPALDERRKEASETVIGSLQSRMSRVLRRTGRRST